MGNNEYTVINLSAFLSQAGVGFLYEVHVLYYSALPVVVQLVLDPLLLHEALPIQLALTHRVYLATPVVDGPHHVVEVLKLDVGFAPLELLLVLLFWLLLNMLVVMFFLNYLELAGLLVEEELFACEHYPFAGLHRVAIHYLLGYL